MNGVTVDLVEVFASWFVSCWDYYAVQQRDGSYRPARARLTRARLVDHLMGRYTLGTYVLDRAGCCAFAVLDADSHDGVARLVRLGRELAVQGVPSVLEASRRGGHVWVFLERPTPAWAVRAWLGPYAVRYGVELYPKQDSVRPGGMGSLVRLPLGVHRLTEGWYPFLAVTSHGVLVPVAETVAACCSWVGEHAQRVAVPDALMKLGAEVQEERVFSGCVGCWQEGAIVAWCRCQDIVEVVSRYTSLDGRGVGRCPLPGHHYRGDVRPSLQVFGGADPHWYCYTWGRAGNVFDFLCYYHGLSAREGWQWLKQGRLE